MGKTLIIKGADFIENAVETSYKNLINPVEIEQGKYIDSAGNIEIPTSDVDRYAVSGFIPVNGKDIYCPTEFTVDVTQSSTFGGYLVYDSNFTKIRFNRLRKKQYTYVSGDAYVRFPLRNDALNNPKVTDGINYLAHFAAYGNRALPYKPYEGE